MAHSAEPNITGPTVNIVHTIIMNYQKLQQSVTTIVE